MGQYEVSRIDMHFRLLKKVCVGVCVWGSPSLMKIRLNSSSKTFSRLNLCNYTKTILNWQEVISNNAEYVIE